MDDAEKELRELAEGIDIEEDITQSELDGDGDDDDDVEGWNEQREGLSIPDHEALDASLHPVRLLLVKVSWL